jgi:hypothetical protein
MSNCPNCGAPLSLDGGLHCDYCGTRFEEPELVEYLYADGERYFAMCKSGIISVNEVRQFMRVER